MKPLPLAGNLSTDDGKYDSLFGEVGNIFPCQVQPELGGGRIGEKAESKHHMETDETTFSLRILDNQL